MLSSLNRRGRSERGAGQRTSSWPSLAEPTAIQSPTGLKAREDSRSLQLGVGQASNDRCALAGSGRSST